MLGGRRAIRIMMAGVLLLGLWACGGDDDAAGDGDDGAETVRLWIAPELVDCEGGAGPQQCLQISRSEDGEPELFYDSIAGFEFEEGTSYVIDVTVTEVDDPPTDGSSLSYTLVEIVETSG